MSKGEDVPSTLDRVHELNRRVLANPSRRLATIQEFYDERVKANDRDGADMALLMRSIVTAQQDNEQNSSTTALWEKIVAVSVGLVFVVILLIIAVLIPHPTQFQL